MATSINKPVTRRQDGIFAVFSREEIDRKKSGSETCERNGCPYFQRMLLENGDGTDPFDFDNVSVAE